MQKFSSSDSRTKSVPAIEKGMLILEKLATSHNGLGLAELTRELALPKSSTYGLLLTLERLGYLHRNESTGRYMFGMKILSLANMAMNGLNLRKISTPHIRSLMNKTKLTVHLSIQEQNEVVIIEKADSPYTPKVETWVGKRMGIHCTAAGKALLSDWPEELLDRLVRHGLPRYNDNTIISPKKLKKELDQVRKQGFSVDDEEETIGSRCIGAPIRDTGGQIVGAVSVAGYKQQIHQDTFQTLVKTVQETADAITNDLCEETKP
ncbi:MAG TPA: IclR family transcriptional regulator [Pyrinomonadaceae bacterium]|nr:IclR family transcriptional regulator [Pyrinomonadaceae bacterium]